jgi:hypothetical protein
MVALNKLGLSPAAPVSSHYARSDMVRGGRSEADTESLYSQVTGVPPRAPVPRKPVNMRNIIERGPSQSSRFSGTTASSSRSDREVSEAQRYAKSVEGRDELRPEPGVVPAGTGTTQASRNPFLPK